MARVLLISPPLLTPEGTYVDGYQGVRPRLPALGLAYNAGVLEKAGHRVRIIEGMAEPVSPAEIAQASQAFDIAGVTSITFQALLAHGVARAIKEKNRDIPVVMGGPHASVVPEEALGDENVDYVVTGEGENTFLELVEALESGKSTEHISGIAYRRDGKVVFTAPRPAIEDIDAIPMPARHLLPMHLYRSSEVRARRHPALHMMSTRGCPYNCSFCSNKIMHRSRLRLHSPERVVEEMSVLVRDFGAREIHFWDDCFVYDEERVHRICALLHRTGPKVPWDCEATVNRVNPAMLKEMKSAGCFGVSYGIETGSEERLKELNKGWLSLEKIRQAVEWTRKAGLRARGYFMFGFAGETLEEMEQTIRFAKELDLDFATFSLLVPLPGTLDYDRAKRESSFDPYYWRHKVLSEISFPSEPVYVPAGVTAEQLLGIHRRACREFYFRPRVILKRLWELRSLSNLAGALNGALRILAARKAI